jgi:hypothetical protein
MNLRHLWRRITTSNYSRALAAELERARAENVRLLAENRALLNSILGIAGVPPLPATAADLAEVEALSDAPLPAPSISAASAPTAARSAAPGAARPRLQKSPAARKSAAALPAGVVSPTRRRSWQQINRMLEYESAQKEKPIAEPLGDAHM